MVGHMEVLKVKPEYQELESFFTKKDLNVHFQKENVFDFHLEDSQDLKVLLPRFLSYLETKQPHQETIHISSLDRSLGTLLGSEITKRFQNNLQDDTYQIECIGGAGQSFGAFIPKGLTMQVEGDANDYFGKGLSGGKLIIHPSSNAQFMAQDNVIVGNVALYGATSGEAYISGRAGERFAVRNSGAIAVVEGCGDHGLEYMTGGKVVVLGKTGKNFAAGMSGGVAYVLDEGNDLYKNLNKEMISIEKVETKPDIQELHQMIKAHVEATGSEKGQEVLAHFQEYLPKFKKIIPDDYKKMTTLAARLEEQGMSPEQAQLEAFNENFSGKGAE